MSAYAGPAGGHATPSMDAGSLAFLAVGSLIGVIFIVGLQTLNKRSAKIWTRPSWNMNPFSLKRPLQFFHFAGYFFIVSGAVSFILIYLDNASFVYESVAILAAGIGALLGVWLSRVLFAFKFKAASGEKKR